MQPSSLDWPSGRPEVTTVEQTGLSRREFLGTVEMTLAGAAVSVTAARAAALRASAAASIAG